MTDHKKVRHTLGKGDRATRVAPSTAPVRKSSALYHNTPPPLILTLSVTTQYDTVFNDHLGTDPYIKPHFFVCLQCRVCQGTPLLTVVPLACVHIELS